MAYVRAFVQGNRQHGLPQRCANERIYSGAVRVHQANVLYMTCDAQLWTHSIALPAALGGGSSSVSLHE